MNSPSLRPPARGDPPVDEVCVLDPVDARRTRVTALIARAGARAAASRALSEDARERRTLAVIAVESSRSDDAGVAAAHECRRRGYRILAIASGSKMWTLASRCHVLAAGAQFLLDPDEGDFDVRFTRGLARMLLEEASRHEEDARVSSALHELGIVGDSRTMADVFRQVTRAAQLSDVPVLLTGETGTGKELLARALHRLDPARKAGPFVALNCAALPAHLAEAELFGHRRGAFTGADRDRPGLFRAADKGVLFLDEIGELDVLLQAKLLRILQDGRVLALGEDREVPANPRVIAATNRDLRQMLADGAFRVDLFHRLSVVAIHVPPLRERLEDVAALVRHLVVKHANLCAGRVPEVDPEFITALGSLPLEGNARELENLIRRVLTDRVWAGPLTLADLPQDVLQQLARQAAWEPTLEAPARSPGIPSALDVLEAHQWNLSRCLAYYERLLLEAALHTSGGNHSRASRMLGVTPRTIYNKIRKLMISSCA